jgi:hypothetical protein
MFMQQLLSAADPLQSGIWSRIAGWWFARPVLFALVAGATLLGALYAEENWRGKRSWERCKRELEAKGAALDWAAFRPAKVADEDNFLKAPEMANWFGGNGQNELTSKLSFGDRLTSLPNTNLLAEVWSVAPESRVAADQADLVLDYAGSSLALAAFEEGPAAGPDPASSVIPLIVMDAVPLADAIRNLARQAGLSYILDPGVQMGEGAHQMTVSFRWENVTARQALIAMLRNYNLQLVGGSGERMAKIKVRDQTEPKVEVEASARARIETLIRSVLEQGGNQVPVPSCHGSQDLALVARPLQLVKPLRVFVRADGALTRNEVAQFLPANAFASMSRGESCYRIEATATSVIRVFLGTPVYYTAADYVACSDRCVKDFDAVRVALKRPYVQLAAECEEPAELRIPKAELRIPNLVGARVLTQTLAQRAQCYLLLNQPEAALHELTLIHDLCRTLTRRPVRLVPAMINVAVAGVYVSTMADGLRLKVWREPQLVAIEQQLEEVNLMLPVTEAMQLERFTLLRTFESGQVAKLLRSSEDFAMPPAKANSFRKLKDARYALLTLVPRGWIYQNMATIGSLHQGFLDAVDGRGKVIFPRELDGAQASTQQIAQHSSPATFLAAVAFPDFTRAWQVLGRRQTLVNEAFLACALERHRLAHGRYPESLGALVPEFADAVPPDVINGQPLHYRLGEDGTFLLYSAGWNGVDDGGLVCRLQGGATDILRGDWVWGGSL